MVGLGYDLHPLIQGRRLVLGGVEIPFDKGLDGHSDADVLVHAIIDALLGAANLGDIGTHFPSEPKYKDASSLALLCEVDGMLKSHGWQVVNIDATIVAEKPRLSSFIPQMRQNISGTLGISTEQVGVKSTTSKGLGPVGKGAGIATLAVALVERP